VFGTNYRCENLNYILLRDVLQNRKVRMLLFSMPVHYQADPLGHMQSFRWMLDGEDDHALDGLSFGHRAGFRAGTILGAPRHLLSVIRPDQYDDSAWAVLNGGSKVDLGIRPAPFVRFTPTPPAFPAGNMIYGPGTHHLYRFTGQELPPYHMHYLRQIDALLREHQIPVALIRVPLWTERHEQVVTERMPWDDVFQSRTTLIGIPPATLFQGLSDPEIDKLFYNVYSYDNHHFSRNGNEYFTRVVTPAVLETYVRNVPPAD
jgi:hypothetical protein